MVWIDGGERAGAPNIASCLRGVKKSYGWCRPASNSPLAVALTVHSPVSEPTSRSSGYSSSDSNIAQSRCIRCRSPRCRRLQWPSKKRAGARAGALFTREFAAIAAPRGGDIATRPWLWWLLKGYATFTGGPSSSSLFRFGWQRCGNECAHLLAAAGGHYVPPISERLIANHPY
jgi:hypothetical protein